MIMKILETKQVIHYNSTLTAMRIEVENEKQIICEVHRKGKIICLRECNDGSKLTAINQAINQAKGHVDTCNQHNW